MALVCSLFDPNTALMIYIGFGKAIGYADHNDDAVVRLHIFSQRVHWRTCMLRSRIAEQLIQTPHCARFQPQY